ncbi:anti-sigma factor [Paraflavitalea pollutisoli]|uniref:anti-sigma factor n=1 Tax=Paraflavitalea pollutisoli TaxID=3034143 RepID=UPI0023EBEF08|nr:anti-sigma factor [Paraflavitalea sp. H1-2-19X]
MSANNKHILHDYETPPPAGVWDTISARLDTEYDAREGRITDKLYAWEATPPPAVWQQIHLALEVNEAARETAQSSAAPAKVIRLPFRQIAVAAIVLIVAGLVTWSFLNQEQATTAQGGPQIPAAVADTDNTKVQPSLPAVDASIAIRPRQRIDVARRVSSDARLIPGYSAAVIEEDPFNDIQYAAVKDMRAQTTTHRTGIKAPLIKDANGNIILDKNLIISRDKNYIIITCPNGEQTRISAKFLPVLTDLNAAADPTEYFDAVIRESSIWKGKFTQWRYKLMQEASFMPTATNFLDIIALKELIEEQ